MKELSIEDIHEFPSSHEFEREYFISLLKQSEEPTSVKKPLAGASEDEIKFLNVTAFSKEEAFHEDNIVLEISRDNLQIIKVSTAKIFAKVVTELLAKNVLLGSFIPTEYETKFKAFLTLLTAKGSEALETLAFKNEKNEIWLLEASGKCTETTYSLSLTDKTFEIAKFLGKEGGEPPEEEKIVAKNPVDLIIFRHTSIHTKDTKMWVSKIATLLAKVKLWPAEGRTKFIATRYEDDPREKSDFNHPFIEDLLCLPFDRLVFLQKTEIVLNLPKKKTPSFLFVQPANDPIEIAKKVVVEKANDLGFAISNPRPLSAGTVGHIYFKLPGQKTLLDVHGKVYSATPDPEKAGQYLAHFNYFGLSKIMNKEIRAYLSRDSGYKNLLNQDPSDFKYNSDDVFLKEEQKRKKTVVILDLDEAIIKNTVDYFRNEIQNIDIVSDDSYYNFYKSFLEKKNETDIALPAAQEDFYTETISILVGTVDLNLQMTITPPSEEDRFLGHEIKKMFAQPQGWLTLFNADSRNLLTECMYLVLTTKKINKNFELLTATGERRIVAIEFALEEQSNIVRLNFKCPDTKQLKKTHQIAKIDSLECLLIDYALLPEDINAFIKGLREGVERAKLTTHADGPRVIVMASELQKINFEKLVESQVYGFIYKPLEIRRLLFLTAQALNAPFTVYTESNIGWKSDNIPAKISRPAKLVELSEFGAVIKNAQPLKPGTMIYLFKSIFQNAPEQHICVRVYHSEEDSDEPGTYLNSVVYFGITDSFLKFTRTYIRETYATNKAKEKS